MYELKKIGKVFKSKFVVMKAETCSCCVRLINYLLCNKAVLGYKFIHFINYCKHRRMPQLIKISSIFSWCKQEEKLGRICWVIYTGKGLAQNCMSQSEGLIIHVQSDCY